MFETIHAYELPLIAQFQELLNYPFADAYFRTITLMDDKRVVTLFVLTLWIIKGWRWGLPLALILTASSITNFELKHFFELPRPSAYQPALAKVSTLSSYGMPSGAAQTSVIVATLWIYTQRTYSSWFVGILFALSLSFSRPFIGVHFFTDLIGGWIVGFVLLATFWIAIKLFSHFFSSKKGIQWQTNSP